jgi:hypothetical protein
VHTFVLALVGRNFGRVFISSITNKFPNLFQKTDKFRNNLCYNYRQKYDFMEENDGRDD